MFFKRLFAKSGEYVAYEMFSLSHLMLVCVSITAIVIAVYLSRKMDKKATRKTIRNLTIVLWIMEIIKIVFNLVIGNANNPNSYIPLYYCSIPLYCGVLSVCAKGVLKRVGDVFLLVGGIVGGLTYLVSPNTTAGMYPAIHYITMQSFALHSIMVYMGVIIMVTNYIELRWKDIIYYATTIVVFGIVAYIVNIYLDTNLMFVSKNFPGTIVEIAYNLSEKFFTHIVIAWQAVIPFLMVYPIDRIKNKINTK